jgi:hypothetical protein
MGILEKIKEIEFEVSFIGHFQLVHHLENNAALFLYAHALILYCPSTDVSNSKGKSDPYA